MRLLSSLLPDLPSLDLLEPLPLLSLDLDLLPLDLDLLSLDLDLLSLDLDLLSLDLVLLSLDLVLLSLDLDFLSLDLVLLSLDLDLLSLDLDFLSLDLDLLSRPSQDLLVEEQDLDGDFLRGDLAAAGTLPSCRALTLDSAAAARARATSNSALRSSDPAASATLTVLLSGSTPFPSVPPPLEAFLRTGDASDMAAHD
jgi:hypothetical protein